MFKSMRLKNFKAYKDSGEVPLAPLTIIVGANNSGKSTLFQGLLALAQTAQDTDQGWAPRLVTKGFVDLNGFYDILHGKNQTKSSSFQISIGLDGEIARPRRFTSDQKRKNGEFRVPDHADIAFSLDEDRNEIEVRRSTLRMGDKAIISVERKQGHWELVTLPPGSPKDAGADFAGIFPCISIPDVDESLPEGTAAITISHFCASVWTDIVARKITHVGPLRVRVPWYASVGARTGSEMGLGGGNLIADLGSKEKDLRTKKTRLELVNVWLAKRRVLKSVHLEIDEKTSGRMLVGNEWDGPTSINIAGMGEGVSQMLPIIAYTLFSANNDCLLVEQPEIHLHPALQSELGDLFIDVAQSGIRQILVETHSEHLLLRVRRRIAEGTLNPDQVAILFVEKHSGESTVRRLDLNNRGHFSDWPKGFFDEAYQEAMALATAASKKG